MDKIEFDQLIDRIRSGDDEAMEVFMAEMEEYIGGRIKSILKNRGSFRWDLPTV